jgi:hypothetical protein
MPQSKSTKAAGDSSEPASAKPKPASSPIANSYLVVYNAASAAGWLIILVRTLMILAQFGPRYVFLGVGERTRLTQTLAVMEILHSVFGRCSWESVCVWSVEFLAASVTTPVCIRMPLLTVFNFSQVSSELRSSQPSCR